MPADAVSLELPKNLYVESTNRCNLKCKTCIQYRGNWEPQRDLSLAELVMITDQLPELEWTALHGIGEPLMNPALPDMIRRCCSTCRAARLGLMCREGCRPVRRRIASAAGPRIAG